MPGASLPEVGLVSGGPGTSIIDALVLPLYSYPGTRYTLASLAPLVREHQQTTFKTSETIAHLEGRWLSIGGSIRIPMKRCVDASHGRPGALQQEDALAGHASSWGSGL